MDAIHIMGSSSPPHLSGHILVWGLDGCLFDSGAPAEELEEGYVFKYINRDGESWNNDRGTIEYEVSKD